MVPLETPERVPYPHSKVQLAAAKRLESQLKGDQPKVQQKPEVQKKPAKVQKNPAKVQKKPAKEIKNGKSTKAKKPNAKGGPLASVMADFINNLKSQGYSHKQAQSLWRESSEREAIVSTMSVSERKRRRY